MPEQAPDQPVKTLVGEGIATRLTMVSGRKVVEHEDPQSIEAGLEDTVPDPLPDRVTPSVKPRSKTAMIAFDDVIVTVQVPVPEQPPPAQPMNLLPEAAVAVKVSVVESENDEID